MSDLHIGDFYRDTALVLVRLYQQFPRPLILYVEDICGADTPDEFGLHSARFLSCFSTMVWLGQEGYVRYDDLIRQQALDQAVLTQRGLRLLSSRSSLQEMIGDEGPRLSSDNANKTTSNIDLLRHAVHSGSSTQVEHCLHYLLNLNP